MPEGNANVQRFDFRGVRAAVMAVAGVLLVYAAVLMLTYRRRERTAGQCEEAVRRSWTRRGRPNDDLPAANAEPPSRAIRRIRRQQAQNEQSYLKHSWSSASS